MKKILTRLREAKERNEPLYVSRPLLNTDEFTAWAKDQGFATVTSPEKIHVTLVYSKEAAPWGGLGRESNKLTISGGTRKVEPLGDEGAVVLKFPSEALQLRNKCLRKGGCSSDYRTYKPHVTITYDQGDLKLGGVEPFQGDLVFGPEIFKPLKTDWKQTEK